MDLGVDEEGYEPANGNEVQTDACLKRRRGTVMVSSKLTSRRGNRHGDVSAPMTVWLRRSGRPTCGGERQAIKTARPQAATSTGSTQTARAALRRFRSAAT